MKKMILFLIVLMFVGGLVANNIAVSNVQLLDQNLSARTIKIKFDVSWENSWRNSTIPGNWDAAWIFIKARVSTNPAIHVSVLNYGYTIPSDAAIAVPSDAKGFFLYRAADGSGNVNFPECSVLWDYGLAGVASDATLEIKVFAIEMVMVPAGVFKAGDNANWAYSSGNGHYGYFRQGPNDNDPWHILGEEAITTISTGSDGYYYNSWWTTGGGGNSSGDVFTIPDYFPKGYNAIYCMKYEISQGQYVDFLNSLDNFNAQKNRVQSDLSVSPLVNNYVMSNLSAPTYRNGIVWTGNQFACDLNDNDVVNEADDGENIACNYLSWPDLAAYLDWAALRPMTELEYEKICRGSNDPVPLEWAWGTASYIYCDISNTVPCNYTLSSPGSPTEAISTGLSQVVGNCANLYTSPAGPLRCGIFAASATTPTRMITGATYFGVMEMTGNLYEQCITVGNVAGRCFSGLHGSGTLNSTGYCDVDYWPGINGNTDFATPNIAYGGTTGVTAAAGIGVRGSSFASDWRSGRVSGRDLATSTATATRWHWAGGRGVRLVP